MKKREKLSKEDKIDILIFILLAVIGLGLTVLFISLYNRYGSGILSLVTAGISYAYMTAGLLILIKRGSMTEHPLRWALLTPPIYTAIIFLLLLFTQHTVIAGNPSIVSDCLMWSLYSMPSFLPVISLAFLLLLGL